MAIVSLSLVAVPILLVGLQACDAKQEDDSVSTPEEYVLSSAIELDTFDPSRPFADLKELDAVLADKSIVLLGEGDHGVNEAFEYKLRLTAYLYLEHEFDVHAYEIGVGEGILIDEYLQTGDESKLDDLDILDYQSFLSTDAHFAFLEGLRKLNSSRPTGFQPLSYRGFDLDHGRRNAKELVISYLTAVTSSELLSSLTPLVSCIDATEECVDQLTMAIQSYDANRAALEDASSKAEFARYRGVLVNLGDTVQYQLMAMNQDPGADSYRENAMMRNFDVIDADGTKKIIVSSHNMHIARNLTQEGSPWWKMLGQHVVERHGSDNVYGLCMTFYEGTHMVRDSNWVFMNESLGAVPKMYLEDYLFQPGLEMFVLDFSEAMQGDTASGWLYWRVGMLFNGYANSFFIAPANQWDGVIFIKTVSASHQL